MYPDTGGPTTGSTPVTRFSSRLLPLRCVNLAVHDFSEKRLALCFHTGRRVYLQLCPGPASEGFFLCWALLAHMLYTPRAPGLLNTCAEEASSTSEVEEEDARTRILSTDKASPSSETDETSPAASTPEVRSDTGGPLASKDWS